jgi:hypothetical protein
MKSCYNIIDKMCSYGTPKMKNKQLGFVIGEQNCCKIWSFPMLGNEKWTYFHCQSIQKQRNEDFLLWPYIQM